MDPVFLTALGIFTLTTISPGPAMLAILSTGVAQGRLRALVLTAGILSGSLAWGFLALFGMVAFLQQLGEFFFILKIAGAAYLFYLAWKSARGAMSSSMSTKTITSGSLRKVFVTGLLIHLTNPKAVFGWGATIAIGVRSNAPFSDAVTLFLICFVITCTIHVALALLFSTPKVVQIYMNSRRKFQGVLAALFGLAGAKLLTTSV